MSQGACFRLLLFSGMPRKAQTSIDVPDGWSSLLEVTAETDFGQTDFGHPYLTDFGQSDFGQTDFGQKNLTDFGQPLLTDFGQTDFGHPYFTEFGQFGVSVFWGR